MWPLKTIAFFVGFIGACVLSLAYPIVGIANYMLIYLVNPSATWWGKPLEPLGIRYSLTAGICLVLGMAISSTRVPKLHRFLGTWEIFLVMFAMLVVASTAIGTGTSSFGMVYLDKMVKMVIFMVCLTRMASCRKNYMIILWTLAIGALIIGYDAFNAPKDDFARGRLNFIGGPDFRESSGLAAHMAAMIPLIGALFLTAKSWRWRSLALVAGVLAVNTVIQCRTRSAFVGLLAGCIAALFLAPRTRRFRVYIALAVAAIGANALVDQNFKERVATVFHPSKYEGDATIEGRIELWHVAFDMLSDHPFGVGVGQFMFEMGEYERDEYTQAFLLARRVAHNTYLQCVTELGIQGLLLFIIIVALSTYRVWRCFSLSKGCHDPGGTRILAYGLTLSLVIYLVTAAFTNRLYTESFWWVLALPVCLERSVTREIHERRTAMESVRESLAEIDDGNFEPAAAGYTPHCALA